MKSSSYIARVGIAAMFASTQSASAGPEDHHWSKDPASHCAFVVPASMTEGPAFWTGACVDGKASGIGMLRRRDGGRAGAAFLGKMRNGLPEIGVVDLGDGYRAGKFSDGDIGGEAELEPQLRIDAFRIAADAARQVSAKYAAEKNEASAQLYGTMAETLEAQIE
ncbi:MULTISPECIES: hypothetical protein [Agrobacterium]|jgi:hypothetical protein|uniref:Uncharacterized protein n=1 Tax=Agrobacterium fabrum TaxID=1176649 RepID=A0A7Z7BIR9_9HYPH|nr:MULTISPECIES: hypothetical protein [Agrobacterium]MCR6725061.1 hypothetical protein [Agrobacterium fabrum]QKW96701.1 hypothetical protein GSF67_06085 [Agrobacterium sp. CGMCC 11546]UXT57198.1 hypothetical protein FY134_05835 [Agrobacterium fabrum]WCK77426.1 hypothetical protein G6L39_005590 [Agrobacterium fabrum]WIE28508.1 hypothetical protein G6L42_005530 [Agrobacterium fabrum]